MSYGGHQCSERICAVSWDRDLGRVGDIGHGWNIRETGLFGGESRRIGCQVHQRVLEPRRRVP